MKARYIDVPFDQLPHKMSFTEEFWEAERRGKKVTISTMPDKGPRGPNVDLCPIAYRVSGVKPQHLGHWTIACKCLLVLSYVPYGL